MKVCFYFGVFARNGGIEEFTRDLGLALLKSGVEVEVICASLKHYLLDELEDAGAHIVRMPIYWGCRFRIPDLLLLPIALYNTRHCDLVIHRKPLLNIFYRFLSRKPKHVYITAYRPKEQFPKQSTRFHFFSWFDFVITQTREFESDLLSCGLEQPIHILPHIPPSIYHSGDMTIAQRILRVGVLGRLEKVKNHAYAMDVIGQMAKNLPDAFDAIELHVYGDGSLKSALEQKAEEVAFNVEFHGRYKREDLPHIAEEINLFLITSHSEGQCIVALEILAHGRPLFATPIGALPEILRDSTRGCLLPPANAAEAAGCIASWLAEHDEVSAEDIQQSYRVSFDREKIKSRYVELIQQLGAAS
jgi:glycosyltransferase involved in cell wall biosynthesis